MVLASYLILIPGYFVTGFSFQVSVVMPLVGGRLTVTAPRGKPGPIRESTRSMIGLLWTSGSHSGAVAMAIFAILVPAAKLFLLMLGEVWRSSPSRRKVRVSRWSIAAVQIVSKWASPDMFAFSLLYCLLHHMHHKPFVESLQVLDVGFTCYSAFCICSTASTLCVSLPQHKCEEADASDVARLWPRGKLRG